MNKNIIPIFVPHLGCPRDCVFCNQRKITKQIRPVTSEDAKNEIETYLTYFKNKDNIEVAFYGGSFTAIDINLQKDLLLVALEYKKNKIINEIRLSTRPDAIDYEILDMLKEFQVDTIEIGVQSLDDKVLLNSKREHSAKSVYEAVRLIREYDFKLGLQQMIGLPFDTKEKSIYTAREFSKLKPDFVRIYPTLVIKDTQLCEDYLSGKYKALSMEEAIDILKELLKIYISNNITVIRIGLQPTENITLGKDVIAGPFHPSIRQLVESELLYDLVINYFKGKNINRELTIIASNKNISNLAGQHGIIKERLIKNLKINKLKLKGKNISNEELIFIYNNKEESFNIKKKVFEEQCI